MIVATIPVVIAWGPYGDAGYGIVGPMVLGGIAVIMLVSWATARAFLRIELTDPDGTAWSASEAAPETLMGFRSRWVYFHSLMLVVCMAMPFVLPGSEGWFLAVIGIPFFGFWAFIDIKMIRRSKQDAKAVQQER